MSVVTRDYLFDLPTYSKKMKLASNTTFGNLAIHFAGEGKCAPECVVFIIHGVVVKDYATLTLEKFAANTKITVRFSGVFGVLPLRPYIISTSTNIFSNEIVNRIKPCFMADIFTFTFTPVIVCIDATTAVSFTFNLLSHPAFCEWNQFTHTLTVRPKTLLPVSQTITMYLHGASFMCTEYPLKLRMSDYIISIMFDGSSVSSDLIIPMPTTPPTSYSLYDDVNERPVLEYKYSTPPVIEPFARVIIVHDAELSVPVMLEKPISIEKLQRIIASHPSCKTHNYEKITDIQGITTGKDGRQHIYDIDNEYIVNTLVDNDTIYYKVSSNNKRQRT